MITWMMMVYDATMVEWVAMGVHWDSYKNNLYNYIIIAGINH